MIRPVEPGEGPLVAEEFWYPLAREMEPYSPLNALRDGALDAAKSEFETLLREDDRHDFFREHDGRPVGYISAELRRRPSRRLGRGMAIIDLYVKDGHRGDGHGSALLDHVETLADDEDCDYLTVSTEWENHPARGFYDARGYAEKQVEFTKEL